MAQCRAGIVGTMPSLSVRPAEALESVIMQIKEILTLHDIAYPERKSAPFGINLIAHRSNVRLEHDLEVCVRQQVPLIITSLGPSRAIVDRVHAFGGVVFHDVTNMRHARKAIAEGVDGMVAVAAGAGGHGGTLSPFALVSEIRREFDGWIALAGAMSTGAHVAAAIAMGADFAYMGTRFIATQESSAPDAHKAMVIASHAADIVYTPCFSGVPGNYLRPSIVALGLDPDDLPANDPSAMNYVSGNTRPKAWKDVLSAGQGVGAIDAIPSVDELVQQLVQGYHAAGQRLNRP